MGDQAGREHAHATPLLPITVLQALAQDTFPCTSLLGTAFERRLWNRGI